MRWPWWSPRMVISWLDRDPWVAAAFAVPLAIILLVAVAGPPILFLFVPLLGFAALDGMALIAMDFFRRTSGGSAAVDRHPPMPVGPPPSGGPASRVRAQPKSKASRPGVD